jgi:hypothetical protein
MWKYAPLALITITQLYLTFVTFLKYYQFIYIMNNVISSLFKCYRCTYITYWMFLNKDINNHKQNFLNYFVGFFPVKLPIVMVWNGRHYIAWPYLAGMSIYNLHCVLCLYKNNIVKRNILCTDYKIGLS